MANEETPAGFLSRWSRRKAEVRQGLTLDAAGPSTQDSHHKTLGPMLPHADRSMRAQSAPPMVNSPDPSSDKKSAPDPATPPKPAPSMADVQSLTQDSDFAQFMANEVAPDVKNAAMKKLFADPHFNVMDRMDVYIDDYGQPDPIPPAMLRQMVGAKFLNLFDDEVPQVVAQSVPDQPISNTERPTHDHLDLQLQPDPASRCEDAGPKPV